MFSLRKSWQILLNKFSLLLTLSRHPSRARFSLGPALFELFSGSGLADVSMNTDPESELYKDNEYAARLVTRLESVDISLMYHWGEPFSYFRTNNSRWCYCFKPSLRPRSAYGGDLTFTVDRFGFRFETYTKFKTPTTLT